MSPGGSETGNSEENQSFHGYRIIHYDTVASTNDIAKEIAKKNREEKIVVLAEKQTSGKGRLGRRWISPKGGVWLSLILRPKLSLEDASKLTFIMSLSVAETIRNMFGLTAEVKWPNDILIKNRKICGILAEANSEDQTLESIVVGVGINANVDLGAFPASLRSGLTSLRRELGHEIKRRDLVQRLLQTFERNYQRMQRGLWKALLQKWKSQAPFLGRQVQVKIFNEIFSGVAHDIGEDGALIVKLESGKLKRVVAGDMTLL